MTYAFTQDVPIDEAFYRRIAGGLGSEPPQGLILHLAVQRPGRGLRYYDVWETERDCARFTDERLHPVVHQLLAELFGADLPPDRRKSRCG